jgi:serine/threonine-protein kinase RsbW
MRLQLQPISESVGLARRTVRQYGDAAGMEAERLDDVCLAVTEAVTNAITVHQAAAHDEPVAVEVSATADGVLCVDVIDCGPGFDPLSPEECEAAVRDRTGDLEGGLGVTLMRALADDIAFDHEDGMTVRMYFGLQGGG